MMKKKQKLACDEEEEEEDNKPPLSIIPDDAIENILTRLPVKSLLRFKSVCKSWARTISDPRFAETHLHLSRSRPNSHYPLMWYAGSAVRGPHHMVRYEGKKSRSAVPYPWSRLDDDVCCSCDGLVLIKRNLSNNAYEYVLWNPSSRSHIVLECPQLRGQRHVIHGLCYDGASKDYKVVIGDRFAYAVFHCRSNRWSKTREHDKKGGIWGTVLEASGVPFGRGFYWIFKSVRLLVEGSTARPEKCSDMVVFDSRDETLYEVPMPSILISSTFEEAVNDHKLVLKVLGGCLCLTRYTCREPNNRIWCLVKIDDDWVEIDEALPFTCRRRVVPMFLTHGEDEMILDVGDRECFVVCDLRRKSFEMVEVSSCGGLYPRLLPCLENLFFSFPNSHDKRVRKSLIN